MAEERVMAAEYVVSRRMNDEHLHLVRDSLRWMVEQLMEAEFSS